MNTIFINVLGKQSFGKSATVRNSPRINCPNLLYISSGNASHARNIITLTASVETDSCNSSHAYHYVRIIYLHHILFINDWHICIYEYRTVMGNEISFSGGQTHSHAFEEYLRGFLKTLLYSDIRGPNK